MSYGQFGRPVRLLEAYKDWRDDQLALGEADSKADFPTFLFGPVRQSIYKGYSKVAPVWERYAAVQNMPDFRESRIRGLNGLKGIGYVGDHGDYPGAKRSERPPASLIIDTYGAIYSITRQAIRNDDTGDLLNSAPGELGYAAGNFVAELIIATIESNPIAPDGTAMFHNSRGNTVTAALSEDSLADAITWMEDQNDGAGYRIRINPATLAVKTARMEAIAKRILSSQTAGSTIEYAGAAGAGSAIMDKGTLNPMAGMLPANAVVRDPFWSDANDWYLLADPSDVPAFAVGFLDGKKEPFVGLKDPGVKNALGAGVDPYDFEFDTIDFKVRLDTGVGPVDPQAAYRSIVT